MKILILEGLHGNNKGKKCQWRLKRTNLKVGERVVLNCHDWKIIKIIGEKKRNVFPEGTIISEYSTGFIDNKYHKAIKEKVKEIEKILIIKNIETKKCRKVKADEIDCFNPNIGDHINHYEIIVKIINKEVKKVGPYFEMEVVKVKKEEKEWTPDYCPCCGQRTEKKKGNWVNGECIDKIKFPCFCSYIVRVTGRKRYGKIDKSWDDIAHKDIYQISKITSQGDEISVLYENTSLKKLIINLKIKILKGKIILYEEE